MRIRSVFLTLAAKPLLLTLAANPLLLTLAATPLVLFAATAGEIHPRPPGGERLVFVGDILLSREVARELSIGREFPWRSMEEFFRGSDLLFGNLEGAVGEPGDCIAGSGPCFPIEPDRIPLLARARFNVIALANNHSGDLGAAGLAATRRALAQNRIFPVDAENSPRFVRAGGITVGIVAITLVAGRDGRLDRLPSIELARKLRLARSLSNLVVVSAHWGDEFLDWPSIRQREAAKWLVRNGASIVIGHHPHVVQPPACVLGRPVFWSLGNHLFDQKYEATKRGLIADCRVEGDEVACHAVETEVTAGSFHPRRATTIDPTLRDIESCRAPLLAGLQVGGIEVRPVEHDGRLSLEGIRQGRRLFETRPVDLASIETGRLAGEASPGLLLSLERHPSDFDGEIALRPHVYEVGPRGLVPLWRGTALAWPLSDARLLPGTNRVCALHRGDSFAAPDAGSRNSRTALYRWNKFGFSADDDPSLNGACRELWSGWLE